MNKDRYPIAPQKVVLYAGAYVYEGGGDQSQWVLPLFEPSILRSQLETALLDLNGITHIWGINLDSTRHKKPADRLAPDGA